MACLHITEYQSPLCRACETGKRKEATVVFYQKNEAVYQLMVSSTRTNIVPISYACGEHVYSVRIYLETILKEHTRQGRKPRWKYHIW